MIRALAWNEEHNDEEPAGFPLGHRDRRAGADRGAVHAGQVDDGRLTWATSSFTASGAGSERTMAGGSGAEWIFAYDTWPRKPAKHLDIACEDWRPWERLWDRTAVALDFFHRHLPFTTRTGGAPFHSRRAFHAASAITDRCSGSKTGTRLPLRTHRRQVLFRMPVAQSQSNCLLTNWS